MPYSKLILIDVLLGTPNGGSLLAPFGGRGGPWLFGRIAIPPLHWGPYL